MEEASMLCPAIATDLCAEGVPMKRWVSSDSQDLLHREKLCEGEVVRMATHVAI